MENKKRRTRLNDIAYEYIKEQILSHELISGMPIVETAIAEALGISRTPVREAIKRLEDDGLVYTVPDTGTFVQQLTQRDVEEINELRVLLETAALRHCIEHVPLEKIQECRAITLSISDNDSQEVLRQKDQCLHDMIAEYCPNQRLVNYLSSVKLQQQQLRFSRAFPAKRRNRMRRQHLMLLDLIEERNYKKAAKALEKHLDLFTEFMLEINSFPEG